MLRLFLILSIFLCHTLARSSPPIDEEGADGGTDTLRDARGNRIYLGGPASTSNTTPTPEISLQGSGRAWVATTPDQLPRQHIHNRNWTGTPRPSSPSGAGDHLPPTTPMTGFISPPPDYTTRANSPAGPSSPSNPASPEAPRSPIASSTAATPAVTPVSAVLTEASVPPPPHYHQVVQDTNRERLYEATMRWLHMDPKNAYVVPGIRVASVSAGLVGCFLASPLVYGPTLTLTSMVARGATTLAFMGAGWAFHRIANWINGYQAQWNPPAYPVAGG